MEGAVGESIQFSIEATGAVSYQWQNSLDGAAWSKSSLSGYNTNTITIPVKESRYNYLWRCVVTDASGNTLESESAQIIKPVPLTITTQPVNVEALVGDTIQFTVIAESAVSYQWQNSKDQLTWSDSGLSGNGTATITIPVTENRFPYFWRCVLTGKNGETLESDAVQILKKQFSVEPIDETTAAISGYNGTDAVVVIPETVGGYTIVEIGESAFESNTVITSVTLPSTVTSIGNYAFRNCTNLDTIILSTNLQEIGIEAFEGCTKLTGVEFPKALESLAYRAFYGCSELSDVNYPMGWNSTEGNDEGEVGEIFAGTAITAINVPTGATLPQDAFNGCTNLTEITVATGVTVSGTSQFAGCTGLESFTAPSDWTSVAADMFNGCTGLESVSLPNAVTTINARAFKNCTSLATMTTF